MNELALLEAILAELRLQTRQLYIISQEVVNAQTDKPAATKPANRPTKAKG